MRLENKIVYNLNDAYKLDKSIIGVKAKNLALLSNFGIKIPFGGVISLDLFFEFEKNNQISISNWNEIKKVIIEIEEQTGKKFGAAENPLLISCRSSAEISMPGMMDSILNIGLNDKTVNQLYNSFEDPYDIFHSYIQNIVMLSTPIPEFHQEFSEQYQRYKENNQKLSVEELSQIISNLKQYVLFPQDVYDQLRSAIIKVLSSWNSPRAKKYRNLYSISNDLGTAVVIQEMIYGNLNSKSGTGVVFSRNPISGKEQIFGEYLVKSQGEELVLGKTTPKDIRLIDEDFPGMYESISELSKNIEKIMSDMQEIEFTIQEGVLWILQSRNAKRTQEAENVMQHDIRNQISDAKLMLNYNNQDLKKIDEKIESNEIIGLGLPASPGLGTGMIIFDPNEVEKIVNSSGKVILVREFTTPEDIGGIIKAQGVITQHGGITSHAAVVARSLAIPAVVGVRNLILDLQNNKIILGNKIIQKGDWLTLDGTTGEIFIGNLLD